MKKIMASFSLLILLFSLRVSAEDLSEKLMSLRSQVQLEADQLESEKQSLNAQIQSLTVEKGELESKNKILSAQIKEMQKALSTKKKIIGGEEPKGYEGLSTEVKKSTGELLNHFKTAVPFKYQERKKRFQNLLEKFEKKELNAAGFFEKYWVFLQDELRLSQNIELQKGEISIEGKNHQVELLHLGMIQLYFRTLDGRMGYAKKLEDQKWAYEFFAEATPVQGLSRLFEAKEKQVEGGAYSLPLKNQKNFVEVSHVF